MLSGRMIRVLDYLQNNGQTSYKEISRDLDIKERYIRYDIDKINDFLYLNHYPLIEKKSKGMITFQCDKKIDILRTNEFIYSAEERIKLILLILLFDEERLKMNRLSQDFQVSRSTIKNDMSSLEHILLQQNIYMKYSDHFYLEMDEKQFIQMMIHEISQYIYLLKTDSSYHNSYELYVFNILSKAYKNISIKAIISWIDHLCDRNNCEFSDANYCWYVSNILVFIWYVLHKKQLPHSYQRYVFEENIDILKMIDELQDIIGVVFDQYYRNEMMSLLSYMNENELLSEWIDPLYVQSIVTELTELMSKRLDIDFSNDTILVDGLLKHIVPLIKRASISHYIYHDVTTEIPNNNHYIFKALETVIKEMKTGHIFNDYDEITYLAVHFIASMNRLEETALKHVLIVCYHGYGSSTILRETLTNEFTVQVIDVIPSYKISTYNHMSEVDCIISTVPLKNTYGKDVIVISPILTKQDYQKIKEIGIKRKKVSVNYSSLNAQLDFLDEHDRMKVLRILQKELGHSENQLPKNVYKVSDLLNEECIEVIDKKIDWQEAILESSTLLEKNEKVIPGYGYQIIEEMKQIGFYCVTDGYFALFHGKNSQDVFDSGMSLMINKQVMSFDEKQVHVVFCLASKDKKDQIPAMILLMRMVKKTSFLQKIENACDSREVYQILKECEKEVIS